MRRAQYGTHDQTTTLVVILDDESTAFLDQEGITDVNGYLNGLLAREKARQESRSQSGQKLDPLLEETPDTSGYPEIDESFGN